MALDTSDLVWNVFIRSGLYCNHIFFDRIELQNVWGHVNMYARGAGQAVAQLDVNYGVDFEPFKVNDHVALCL